MVPDGAEAIRRRVTLWRLRYRSGQAPIVSRMHRWDQRRPILSATWHEAPVGAVEPVTSVDAALNRESYGAPVVVVAQKVECRQQVQWPTSITPTTLPGG